MEVQSEGAFARRQSECMLSHAHTFCPSQVDFARLKSDIQLLERNDFTLMKTENERLMTDVEKLKQRLREEITRTTAGVRLDLNLEKGACARGLRHERLLIFPWQAESVTSRRCTPSRSRRCVRGEQPRWGKALLTRLSPGRYSHRVRDCRAAVADCHRECPCQ